MIHYIDCVLYSTIENCQKTMYWEMNVICVAADNIYPHSVVQQEEDQSEYLYGGGPFKHYPQLAVRIRNVARIYQKRNWCKNSE